MKRAELWFQQIWPGLAPDPDIISLIRDCQRDAIESAAELCDEEAQCIMGVVTSVAHNLAIDIRALAPEPQEKP